MQVFAHVCSRASYSFHRCFSLEEELQEKLKGEHKHGSSQIDECEAVLYKPELFSQGEPFKVGTNTPIRRCFRLMYNNRPTVKTVGKLQLAAITPEYVRKRASAVQYFKYVTQHADLFKSEE